MFKRVLVGIVIAVVLVTGGVYGGFVWQKSRVENDIQAVFAFLWPTGQVSWKNLDYSIFSDVLTLDGVELSSNDADALSVNINKIILKAPNRDAMHALVKARPIAAAALDPDVIPSLAETLTFRGMHVSKGFIYDIDLDVLSLDQPLFGSLPFDGGFPDDLLSLFASLRFRSFTLDGLQFKTVWNVREGRKEALDGEVAHMILEGIDPALFQMLGAAEDIPAFFDVLSHADIGRIFLDGVMVRRVSERPLFAWEYEPNFRRSPSEGVRMPSPGTENVNMHFETFDLVGVKKGYARTLRLGGLAMDHTFKPKKRARTRERYHLGMVALDAFDLARTLRPLVAVMDDDVENGAAAGALVPERLFAPALPVRTIIRDLRFENPDLGIFALKELIGTSTVTDGITTQTASSFRGVVWSFPPDDGVSFRTANDLGYRRVLLTGQMRENYDPGEKLYKASISLTGADIGAATLGFELENYPRTGHDDHESVFLASFDPDGKAEYVRNTLDDIVVRSAALYYEDRSLTRRVFAHLAEPNNSQKMVESLCQRLRDEVEKQQQLTETDVSPLHDAVDEISRFLTDPTAITFTLKPETPIPLREFWRFENGMTAEEFVALLKLAVAYVGKD